MSSLPTRKVVTAFSWLFVSLAMVALLSQPGAMHDEWYHASSIWCGQGERSPYCPSIVTGDDALAYATTNIDAQNCQRNPELALLCPTDQIGGMSFLTNDGRLYPRLFYFSMSWFVTPSVELSIAVVRWANALIITTLLALITWLLPARYRLVLFLAILSTFTVSGYILTASLQPSSWTMIGVGFGWLPLHAAVARSNLDLRRRVALGLLGIIACAMAVGSRNDGLLFLTFTLALASMHLVLSYYPTRKKYILGASLGVVMVLTVGLELLSPLAPSSQMRSLYSYTAGELDNTAFFSHYLIQGLPNALEALGTFPTMSAVWVPEIVYVAGLLVLGALITRTYQRSESIQLLGSLVGVFVTSLVIMAHVAQVDDRDPFGVEPRYSFPLLIFVVGWWFFTGPTDLMSKLDSYLTPSIMTVCAMFAVAMFTFAERYVDRQTYGFRLLPEGLDQWWWSWMPVGPNVVLVIAVVAMWKFFRHMMTVVNHDETVSVSST